MPSLKKVSTHPSPSTDRSPLTGVRRKPFTPQESAFSAHFLDRARRRQAASEADLGPGDCLSSTHLTGEARWGGPWEVERVPAGDGVLYVVVRKEEPAREGGGARLAFVHRQDALLAAAALAALATTNDVTLNTEKRSGRRSRFGYPIHAGGRHLGHITRPEEAFPAAFHTVRRLAADPASVALFVEALDAETLAILGRAIMRRLSG